MKTKIITISLMVSFLYVLTTQVRVNAATKFDKSSISQETLKICENFKNKKGQERYSEFNRLLDFNIFPSCPMKIVDKNKVEMDFNNVNILMTTEELIDLIGQPDKIRDENTFYVYNLKTDYRGVFFILDNYVMSVTIENSPEGKCEKKQKQNEDQKKTDTKSE